jgi:endonuclease/exonuclease/phosphatase family metal-dependent hydrolase
MTLLAHGAREVTRAQLPGSYAWPERVFQLKRCAVFARVPSPVAGRDWVLINLHLSAFDDGTLRSKELGYLRERMLELHAQGHYVVLGGDWNSTFPGVDRERFVPYTTTRENLAWIKAVPRDWTPAEWQWAYDSATPTVRTNDQPYRVGENYRTIIDGFLVSPNVEVEWVRAVDLGFSHSDHQPVRVQLRIREGG